MKANWLFERLMSHGDREALVGAGGQARYRDLLSGVDRWNARLAQETHAAGVVAFDGDVSPDTVALLLALLQRGSVAVPLTSASPAQKEEFVALACADCLIDCRPSDGPTIRSLSSPPKHVLLDRLAAADCPGLVLFSSGSTGKAKAILHDFERLLEKFQKPRPAGRILSALLLDHIGGINTLLFALANGGTIATAGERSPSAVCAAIARHRVEILPTTPTFLNLLLLSEEYRRHDLSSLRLITYGTEPMPTSTLQRLQETFPNVKLQQTYGLSELGILRSKSRDDGSLWVKVGGEDYETKVVQGTLWIRARSAMLGYLNADSPFDATGWFNTQDAVEQDGEWLRFLGRTSEIINVGGQKVYPAEVESVLLEMDNVADVTVRGERNPLLGQCVVARVNLRTPETPLDFKARMQRYCQGRLARYMIPVKVEIAAGEQHGARLKRMRGPSAPEKSKA